jgi:branched-chain amino acid transport system substrate-binding protein
VRPTIKIGLVAPFEGRYRAFGYDVIYAARLALSEVNQAGGVAGYGVELVAYDDGAQPAMAVEQAHKLDVDPDVLGVIGHFREETTRAAVAAYAQAGLPLVAPAVLDPRLTQEHEAFYRLGPPPQLLAGALLERASQLAEACPEHSRRASPENGQGAAQIVLVTRDGPLGASLEDLAPAWEAVNSGWRFATVSADGADWRSNVLTCNPAVVLCDLDPVRAGEVVLALRRAGWSGSVLGGPVLASSDFATVAGQAAEGAHFVTSWPFPLDIPGGAAFAAAYRGSSDGVEPGPLAIPAYEAAWILIEALERAAAGGAPTRQNVSAALSLVEREGLLGHVGFDEGRTWSAKALYWYRIGPQGVPRLTQTVSLATVPSLVGPFHVPESG